MMTSDMMLIPLTLPSLLEHAAQYHGSTEIVSRAADGTLHRYTYAHAHSRSKKLALALDALAIRPGDRLGTLAWNSYRHFELYYGISGSGAITHTINPRLLPEQISWIINDADDAVVFFDPGFAELIDVIAPKCPGVRHWVALAAPEQMPDIGIGNLLCYESLLESVSDDELNGFNWPQIDEVSAATLCYTSGTTGNPKGVLYSHRSTILHAMTSALPDCYNLSCADVISPAVPMFHVNAWSLPYAAPLVGAKLVLPGPVLDGETLFNLFRSEGVTLSAGVPTVWLNLLQYMQQSEQTFANKVRLLVGGAACPPALIENFDRFGVEMRHAWGMTELSSMGSVSTLKPEHRRLCEEDQLAIKAKQGRPPFGVALKIVDDQGRDLPNDGKTSGALLARGHWVVSRYFHSDSSALTDGWFPTGDVATLDCDGFMQITDRAKDVIKSGGEWISSIELENIAMSHPSVTEAAVVGINHPKWDERPLLLVVLKPSAITTREEILAQYPGKVANFCIPDDVLFIEELPHTATGKINKVQLRASLSDYRWP